MILEIDNGIHVVAKSRQLFAEYTIDLPKDWPKWLKEQADLHEKSAMELRKVASYMEENEINL
jgi:hypothetical protein